jgi:hypothetical protein
MSTECRGVVKKQHYRGIYATVDMLRTLRYTTHILNKQRELAMRTLTNKHIADINVLALTLIAEYTEQLRNNLSIDPDSINMYANDIAYNTRALVEFNAEHDVQQLFRSIMLQDTYIREHFVEVLDYISNCVLINTYEF